MLNFIKEFFRAALVGTGIFLLFTAYYLIDGRIETWTWDKALLQYRNNMFYAIVLYLMNAYWIRFLLTRYEYKLYTISRLTLAVAGNLVITIFGVFLCELFLTTVFYGYTFEQFMAKQEVANYTSSLILAAVVSGFFYGLWYYKYRQDNKVKEQKIIAGTASARFDALKNQLDPHFLFNSLNVLTSLIEEDPRAAQKFTTSLSKVYRYVLEQKNKDLISVDEELNFARTYVRLLKMRFEDSLDFDIPERGEQS